MSLGFKSLKSTAIRRYMQHFNDMFHIVSGSSRQHLVGRIWLALQVDKALTGVFFFFRTVVEVRWNEEAILFSRRAAKVLMSVSNRCLC